MAMRRGASVSKETLELCARDLLEFDDRDVQAATVRIGFTPREEGETAWPDTGTLVTAVRREARMRRDEEEARWQSEEYRNLAADRAANPDKYFTIEEIVAAVMERRKARQAA
jgi:hypothetical protein